MQITFTPIRWCNTLALERQGDCLVVNGETFDFTELPEGAELPGEAIDSDWFAGPVRREDGRLFLTLLLPHSAMAPEAMRFPQPLTIFADGVISIPAYHQPQEASDVQD